MAAFLRFAACAALCGALPFEGGAAPFEGAAPLDGAAPFEGGAPALDGAASLEGAASLDGAAVMVLPLGCEHFPGTCNTLQPFWLAVSKAVHAQTRAPKTPQSGPAQGGEALSGARASRLCRSA
ncbi:hypothetical protein M885DRAFT_80927 [Pelagophyceae sp. CCMP2097]|nr:hypothetical protein M885DRAFT_80927 [Pelagophyceae sp. CCMP2097]